MVVCWQHNEQVNETREGENLVQHGLMPHKPYILPNLTDVVRQQHAGLVGYYVCDRHTALSDTYNVTLKLPYLYDKSINGSRVNVIKFRVRYEQGDKMLPFGEIQYNFALLSGINISIATHADANVAWNSDDDDMTSLETTAQAVHDAERQSKTRKALKHEKIQSAEQQPQPALKALHGTQQYVSGVDFHGNVTDVDCVEAHEPLAHHWSVWLLVTRLKRNGDVKLQSPWVSSCTTAYVRYNDHISVC